MIISKLLTNALEYFISSYKNKIDKNENDKINLKCLKVKFICFFVFLILLILFFWYFLSAFCAVFKNTQRPLIKNALLGYVSDLIIPFIVSFFTSFLICCALNKQKVEDKEHCCYKKSKCYYVFEFIFKIIVELILNLF